MNTDIKYKSFDEYKKEFENDLLIDASDIDTKCIEMPSLKGRYCLYLMEAKKELKTLENLFSEGKNKLMKKIEKEAEITLSKIELENQANSNDIILKIKERMLEVKLLIEFFERCLDVFKGMTYDIKNFIDYRKLEEGR